MTLVPLLPIFHRFNVKFFDGSLVRRDQSIVSIRWSDGRLRNTAGFYHRGPNIRGDKGSEIVLSRPVLVNLPFQAIESTLCHEMIHAWVDLVMNVREGHGPNFRARMKLINKSQDQFKITVRHNFPVPTKPPKWIARCSLCGLSVPYKRLVRGAACKRCCDALYGGTWNASCLLTYESIKNDH